MDLATLDVITKNRLAAQYRDSGVVVVPGVDLPSVFAPRVAGFAFVAVDGGCEVHICAEAAYQGNDPQWRQAMAGPATPTRTKRITITRGDFFSGLGKTIQMLQTAAAEPVPAIPEAPVEEADAPLEGPAGGERQHGRPENRRRSGRTPELRELVAEARTRDRRFVGREDVLAALKINLIRQTKPGVVLIGKPGVGNRSLYDLSGQIQTLHDQLDDLLALRRRLMLCRDHGLATAAEILRSDLRFSTGAVLGDLQQIRTQLERPLPSIPELRSVWLELVQIGQEFEEWDYDVDAQIVRVTTEAIELEEVYLGPFRIELALNLLSTPSRWPAYKVIARDPQPAQGNESVTHPHVNDERLCEGDAAAAIRSALQGGRLCDFFILVRQVLQTYNRHSPYVALDRWTGIACSDCGYLTDDDSRYSCERCGNDFCSECTHCCNCCDDSVCAGCSSTCPSCDETVCSGCQRRCAECGETVCRKCIEDDLCPTCRDQQKEKENEDLEQVVIGKEQGAETNDAPQPATA